MQQKIGIATLYTGLNYGSALQAYAVKTIIRNLGYDAEIFKISGSLIKGRDIRISKLITTFFRASMHKEGKKWIKNYKNNYTKPLIVGSKEKFENFYCDYINATIISYRKLKIIAKKDIYKAFICGSDQVWNTSVFYVDPFYYLCFAPYDKRIAFAPSFGRDYVPDYNKKKIAKYISGVKYKSVRETSGVNIIKELSNCDAKVLIDPTLVLNSTEWEKVFELNNVRNEQYLLTYFLDNPSRKALDFIKMISEKYNLKIISLPYKFDDFNEESLSTSAGPKEFVQLIKNASFVCTDSFHGTAFSLNFNIPFYTFERNYGNASKQSTRIHSILEMVNQKDRYEPENIDNCYNISFEIVNAVLNDKRNESIDYLKEILHDGEN